MMNKIEWISVKSLSQKMMELARAENWEKLVEVERERNIVLHAFFDQEGPHEVSEQEIVEVMAMDKEIMELCLFRRNSVGEKLKRFSNSRRAKNAYLRNQ